MASYNNKDIFIARRNESDVFEEYVLHQTASQVLMFDSQSNLIATNVVPSASWASSSYDPRATTSSFINTTSSIALNVNLNRKQWHIQNMSTVPLYVKLGENCSGSIGYFDFMLQGGNENDDGYGQMYRDNIYMGIVTVTGSELRYICSERY